jgi:hypothetical protein
LLSAKSSNPGAHDWLGDLRESLDILPLPAKRGKILGDRKSKR